MKKPCRRFNYFDKRFTSTKQPYLLILMANFAGNEEVQRLLRHATTEGFADMTSNGKSKRQGPEPSLKSNRENSKRIKLPEDLNHSKKLNSSPGNGQKIELNLRDTLVDLHDLSTSSKSTGSPSSQHFDIRRKSTPGETTNVWDNEDNLDFGHVDVKKIEHCARTLQKQLRIIMNEAPDINKLQRLLSLPKVDSEIKHEVQRNLLVKLAAALKLQYIDGLLPLFDDIVEGSVDAERVNKTSLNEKYHSDRVHDEVEVIDHENIIEDGSDVASTDHNKKDDHEDDTKLPKLPEIHNTELLDRVFIHKSTLNDRTYLSQHELIAAHNERLEFLGDSILNNVVTMIIYERFNHALEGDLLKIRSSLVNNKTLGEFAIAYGLDKRLRSNISDVVLKQGNQKIFADVFEAYVGALAIEHGMDLNVIRTWLNKIFTYKLKEFDEEIEGLEPVNKNAKTDLYLLIGTAAFHPQYKVIQVGDGATKPFKMRCEMGMDKLGEGVAPSAKEAGLRAAMQALKNRHLLEKFGQIRLGMDRNELKIKESTPDMGYFPVEVSEYQLFLPEAKNELYAILNKKGMVPEYRVSNEEDRFKSELFVKNILVAIGVDNLKKKAQTRAAMALLKNKDALREVEKLAH